MLLPTFLSTAALALTANAFLVPLEVAETAEFESVSTVPAPHTVHHRIDLNCETCPFAEPQKEGGFAWKDGVKNNLVMDFTTRGNQLLMNGVPFYPTNSWTMPRPLKAKQELAEKGMGRFGVQVVRELGLSYSLEVESRHQPGWKEGAVTNLAMQVIGIEGKMINVDTVKIAAVQKMDSTLIISNVETAPSVSTPGVEKCTTIMCRAKAILFAKLAALRAAAQKASAKFGSIKTSCAERLPFHPTAGKKPHHHGEVPKFAGKFPPHDAHGYHPGHHGRHGVHRFMHSVIRVFKVILLPVLIGIAAGMAASAIGMLVGQIIVLVWMRYRRATNGTYERVEQVEAEVEEGLPKYEEAPKYEEVEGDENVADEKKGLL